MMVKVEVSLFIFCTSVDKRLLKVLYIIIHTQDNAVKDSFVVMMQR